MRFLFFALFVLLLTAQPLSATKIVLKDGRILDGKTAELSKVDDQTEDAGKIKSRLIVVLDDGLRYIYFPKYNIHRDRIPEASQESLEIFKTGLTYSREGNAIKVLGEYDTSIRFDQFGRRLLPLNHFGGVEYATQAITELSPRFVRARGINLNRAALFWDMRIATNSLPRTQITPILLNCIDPDDLDDRIRLVRFYIQGGLYEDAMEELDGIMADWQDDPSVRQNFNQIHRVIRQQAFERRLAELELRWKAGQYTLVRRFLDSLEKDENLPEQLFMAVRRMLQRYDDFEKNKAEIIARLNELHEKLPEEEKDVRFLPILEEIGQELSLNTIGCFASFQLYVKDENLRDSEKLAIGITGWFAGPNADNRRLTVAATLPETRQLIVEFLQSESESVRPQEIIKKLKSLESARPDLVAKILAHIKAPGQIPKAFPERPGYYRGEVNNPLEGSVPRFDYTVQLPPEYDPNRRYPLIVTLNGLSQSPDMQLDFWSGVWQGGERLGHGSRNGFIVLAPNWNPQKIMEYDFSATAHAAVLFSVKDVFRRFNIDTDRVFITGHGIGGTAAWDIALAHPDLWAGALPFNAVASKYIVAYQNNLQHVPFYLISGELEGINNVSKFAKNATVYNRYLARQSAPFDVTVVRFIGRGQEGFSDEIINAFEWMKTRQRNFAPVEFEVASMRPWDYFFWFVETGNLNRDLPDYVRDPIFWPENDKIPSKMIKITGKIIKATNTVQVDTGPKMRGTLVFLNPDLIDFGAKVSVRVNGANYHSGDGFVEPDIEVILKDAKTRGDRLHPFWAFLKDPRGEK